MINPYISKEGMAVIGLAKYLITTRPDERLRTIESLSEEIGVSVGFIQKAFTTLENDKTVSLSKQGRNGTYIRQLDYQKLVRGSGINHLVCAMPLPYTKHYEGLASGLKAQLGSLPLYFAHMRGADVRAECLKSGIYDLAIMSKLAAGTLSGSVKILVELGTESYSLEHRLIYRENEYETIKRIGVDPASPDQRILRKVRTSP
ncbi:YhfZ family protein, partial [Aeromonas jandaei]